MCINHLKPAQSLLIIVLRIAISYTIEKIELFFQVLNALFKMMLLELFSGFLKGSAQLSCTCICIIGKYIYLQVATDDSSCSDVQAAYFLLKKKTLFRVNRE